MVNKLMDNKTQKNLIEEILRRRTARTNFYDYCAYLYPNFERNWHIELIANKLQEVADGKCKRLIIQMPPRHSKTFMCSVLFPTYFLGLFPDMKVVQTGYSGDRAIDASKLAIDFFRSEPHKILFPEAHSSNTEADNKRILKDMNSLNNQRRERHSVKTWDTAKTGSYYAVGIQGSLAGFGMNLGIVDDYYKDRAEANSDRRRESVLTWYKNTFYTRQAKDAAIIIISTRWHPDDLIGTLLQESDKNAEKWELLHLPAIKEGENGWDCLWESHYDSDKLAIVRESMGEFEFSSLYLQEPFLKGGNKFNVSNIHVVTDSDFPASSMQLRCWDLASSVKERNKTDPDYTVGVLGTVICNSKGQNELWIKDIIRGQWEAPQRDETIQRTARLDGDRVPIYCECFGPYKDTYLTLKKILLGKSIVRKSQIKGDKNVKSAPLETVLEAGNFYISSSIGVKMIDALKNEFAQHPYGKHDDIVDAISILYNECTKAKSTILIY